MRAQKSAALRDELTRVFLAKRASEWEDHLAQWNVPAARIRGLDEVLAAEQVQARCRVSHFALDGVAGPGIHVPNMSFKVNGESVPPAQPRAAP